MKNSAGALLFRRSGDGIEVLLAHPGGPFWARKDEKAWTIPKGEFDVDSEAPWAAAKRELNEETGAVATGEPISLAPVKQPGGKVVHAFAVEQDFDLADFRSNTFSIEWPPRSGRQQEFPEVDRVAWFPLEVARTKLLSGQIDFLDQLLRALAQADRTSPDPTTIRAATIADVDAIAAIYNHYISNTVVTFEEKPIPPSEMAQRMEAIWAASRPWLVVEVKGEVAGYAYAGKWNGRSAYRFSAEITVYLAPERVGRGLGSKLYERLFSLLRERGMHTVVAGIALPNPASVALHEKLGLAQVALFKEVGYKFDRWIDVGYWQRAL